MSDSRNNDDSMWLASLATSLREQRKRANLSVVALASALDVSPNTIKQMERGAAGVAIQTWIRAWSHFRVMPRIAEASTRDEFVTFSVVKQVSAAMLARDPNRFTPPLPSGPTMTMSDLPGARLI